ncbi:hypothetical protein [Neisseria meningitidis]|uniref:hypothetical protein n=1 Tax=Neisseria meningitidis TaxID=487 RepID=UPI001625EED5|nr:hypothetical protein [Neisseria meningitidis]
MSVQGKPHGLIARTGKAIRTDTPKECKCRLNAVCAPSAESRRPLKRRWKKTQSFNTGVSIGLK